MQQESKLTVSAESGEKCQAGAGAGKSVRLRVFTACLLFSLGFTLVFVAMGASAGFMGKWLAAYRHVLTRVSGAVILLLGLFVLGLVKFKPLYAERRFHVHRLGPFTPPLAGMAFAFGWTPCVGPFLGSLLALSAASGTYTQGIFYLAIYSAGLALPFLISALLFTSLLGAFSWIKRRLTLINVFAGLFLVGMGLALLTGRFNALADSLYYQVKLPDLSADAFSGKSVGIITSFVAGLLSFLSPCVLPLVPGYLSFISGVTIDEFTKQGSKNGAHLS